MLCSRFLVPKISVFSIFSNLWTIPLISFKYLANCVIKCLIRAGLDNMLIQRTHYSVKKKLAKVRIFKLEIFISQNLPSYIIFLVENEKLIEINFKCNEKIKIILRLAGNKQLYYFRTKVWSSVGVSTGITTLLVICSVTWCRSTGTLYRQTRKRIIRKSENYTELF